MIKINKIEINILIIPIIFKIPPIIPPITTLLEKYDGSMNTLGKLNGVVSITNIEPTKKIIHKINPKTLLFIIFSTNIPLFKIILSPLHISC